MKLGRAALQVAERAALAITALRAQLRPPCAGREQQRQTPPASSVRCVSRASTRAMTARPSASHVATASCARRARARASPRPAMRARSCDQASPSATRTTVRLAPWQSGAQAGAPRPSYAALAPLPTWSVLPSALTAQLVPSSRTQAQQYVTHARQAATVRWPLQQYRCARWVLTAVRQGSAAAASA